MKGSVITLVILLAIASCGASLFDYFAPISTSAGEYVRNLSTNRTMYSAPRAISDWSRRIINLYDYNLRRERLTNCSSF
jgi:hypothetical protein